MNFEQVLEYIKQEDLGCKSREQFYVFRRHYLINAIYQTRQFTLAQIGSFFNRDYSTVLHSVRKHQDLKRDKLYQRINEGCAKMLCERITFSKQRRNIFDDLEKANNVSMLKRIKRYYKAGYYELSPKPTKENWEKIGQHVKNSFAQDEQNPT